MRRRLSLPIAAAIVGAAVLAAIALISLAPEPERLEPPSRDPFVTTAPVLAGSGALVIRGAGTVRARAEVDIAAQIGGRVVSVNPAFVRGGRVQANEALFRIERESHVYRVRVAEAMLAEQQVVLRQAEEAAAVARAEYARWAEREAPAATQPGPLVLREPQLNAARAAVARDEARLADARLALSRTEVRAPFEGWVADQSVALGQFLSPGQPVGRLIASDAAEVAVPLSDFDAAMIPGLWDLRAGDGDGRVAARIIAEYGDARYSWDGYVDRADATLDPQSRTIDAIVRVPEPFLPGAVLDGREGGGAPPPLLSGKFVEVEIQGVAPDAWYRVRRAALQTGDVVWAVTGETLRIVPVRVLQRRDGEVLVTGALTDGQPLVTGGIAFAVDGMRIRTGAAVVQ